ncbi:dCTP deaminase [Bradyrhizobium elkanii]|uniref:dCTP deaminase n=1 Tax=Bradyrhizobium elkanii TaxID=29448 RepID=UPI00271552C8|nr:dCTP deaminase [Bradyrhizobium elkanii]WLB77006.1 dCTP deaminase [Bradyrhizobium elkanii]
MILTDREIKLALEKRLIIIEPIPGPDAFSSTAVDLTLDANITEFREEAGGIETAIDPGHRDFNSETTLAQISDKRVIPADGWLLKPNRLVLAWSSEYVNLVSHNRIAARVEGKSSLARLGLGVHVTAPTIHAGFDGRIRLEMVNHGKVPIRLRVGMRICQLIFEQTLGTPDKGYQGQFAGQGSP